MQSFKWQISKRLKQAMRERDIDNLTLVRRTDELYSRSHPGHDEDMRAEVYTVLDEYAPNVDIEIFDLVCKVLGVKIELGETLDWVVVAEFYPCRKAKFSAMINRKILPKA